MLWKDLGEFNAVHSINRVLMPQNPQTASEKMAGYEQKI